MIAPFVACRRPDGSHDFGGLTASTEVLPDSLGDLLASVAAVCLSLGLAVLRP